METILGEAPAIFNGPRAIYPYILICSPGPGYISLSCHLNASFYLNAFDHKDAYSYRVSHKKVYPFAAKLGNIEYKDLARLSHTIE